MQDGVGCHNPSAPRAKCARAAVRMTSRFGGQTQWLSSFVAECAPQDDNTAGRTLPQADGLRRPPDKDWDWRKSYGCPEEIIRRAFPETGGTGQAVTRRPERIGAENYPTEGRLHQCDWRSLRRAGGERRVPGVFAPFSQTWIASAGDLRRRFESRRISRRGFRRHDTIRSADEKSQRRYGC